MPVDDTKLNGLDAFTGVGLNARLGAVVDAIGALGSEDIARRAFREEHLPSLVFHPTGLSAPGNPVEIHSANLHTAKYGTAWTVITDTVTDLQITWNQIDLTDVDAPRALIVGMNVEVRRATWAGGGAGTDYCAMVALQWFSGAGWTTLAHTVRPVALDPLDAASGGQLYRDVPVRALLTPAVLGVDTIRGVRGVVALATAGGAPGTEKVGITRANLSVIPIYAELN